MSEQLDLAAVENAALVAYIAAKGQAVWSYCDPTEPDTPYLHLFTRVAHLSWPIPPQLLHLLDNIPHRPGTAWTRRTPQERTALLLELVAVEAQDLSKLDMHDALAGAV